MCRLVAQIAQLLDQRSAALCEFTQTNQLIQEERWVCARHASAWDEAGFGRGLFYQYPRLKKRWLKARRKF